MISGRTLTEDEMVTVIECCDTSFLAGVFDDDMLVAVVSTHDADAITEAVRAAGLTNLQGAWA